MRPLAVPRFAHKGYLKIGEEIYDCRISNMSATGATITFDGPIEVPDHFSIHLTPDGRITRKCSVVWREGIEIGVIFADRLPSK
jgi:hypothetical protein